MGAPAAEAPITAPVAHEREDVHVDRAARHSPFRRPAPSLKLVASNANVAMGGILDFIIEGLESGNGERLSEKDVYKGYAKRCREAGIKPASIEEFVPLLDRACNECGIEREHKSGKVYYGCATRKCGESICMSDDDLFFGSTRRLCACASAASAGS